MNLQLGRNDSIAQKLLLSFLALLMVTAISIMAAIFVIEQIRAAQSTLTISSIPSLARANKLSSIAATLVESSLRISESDSMQSLNQRKQKITTLRNDLRNELSVLENQISNDDHVLNLTQLDTELQNNIIRKFDTLSNLKIISARYNDYFKTIYHSSNDLLDQLLKIKVKREINLSNIVDSLSFNNIKSTTGVRVAEEIHDNIYNVELVKNLVDKLNDIIKNIKDLNSVDTKEHLLLIEDEFDHALGVVIRSIVNIDDESVKNELSAPMLTLIKKGQEKPSIFDLKLDEIQLHTGLQEISNENVSLLHQINLGLDRLVDEVRNHASADSMNLSSIINQSRGLFIVLLFVAIAISIFIIWHFVYKGIVLKLSLLSAITTKISNKDYEFKIDKTGNSEFSKIATALEALQINAKQRDALNYLLTKKSERLRRSNEDLSQFAYVASHDLQEPLRMIGSYVQLLRKRYEGKIDKDADKFINYAVDGCHRMQLLIEGLLKFSKVDSDKDEMQHNDINEALTDVIHDLSIRIRESNALVKWDEILPAYACSTQLKTVFRNIISNGIKYCDGRTPEIHIKSELIAEGRVQYSITDNGIGIDEKYQDKIFVIFKRLHSRNEYSGTGIGLSICKKIVERHGGQIWLTSKPAIGTTFYFTFPCSKQNNKFDGHAIAV